MNAPAANPCTEPAGYRAAFEALTLSVCKNVMDPNQKSLFEIHDAIRADPSLGNRAELVRLFTNNAEEFLAREIDRALVDPSAALSDPQDLDKLMQRLAGNWLALYFLGCPFMQAWEAVAFLAEGTGFPGGASLFKAVGDVYRNARKYNLLLSAAASNSDAQRPVYVLDHNPLAMHKMLTKTYPAAGEEPVEREDGDSAFSDQLTCLGMLYERLQLALYLHAGGPMYFYVPASSLRRALIGNKPRVETETEKWKHDVTNMWGQLKSCFKSEFSGTQLVRIVHDEELIYLPGCVLTSTQAIYRTRGAMKSGDIKSGDSKKKPSPGLAGNYLPTRVRTEFVQIMQEVGNVKSKKADSADTPRPLSPSPSLQGCSLEEFGQLCRELVT